jgi:thioredoxin-like negative regulator of GroEL
MTRCRSIAILLFAAAIGGAARTAAQVQTFIVPSKPVAAPGAARWGSDARAAFAEAKRTGRPLLVDLFAEWCGWCKVMDAKVFSTPAFAKLASGFVLLRVDVEDGGQGSEISERYDADSLPTLLLLEPSGALIGTVHGYKPFEDLDAEIRAIDAVHEKALASYEKLLTSTDAEALRLAASDLYGRRDGPRAARLFARLLEVEPSQGDDAAWIRFFLADSLRRAERYDEANAALHAALPFARQTTDAELAERLALLPFWIARDAARCTDATGALADFERGHPGSVYLDGAKRALAELRGGRATCS